MKPSEKWNKLCNSKKCDYGECYECTDRWNDKNTWLKSDVRKVLEKSMPCVCDDLLGERCYYCDLKELLKKELNKLNEI